jgi:hypothetical protein
MLCEVLCDWLDVTVCEAVVVNVLVPDCDGDCVSDGVTVSVSEEVCD